MINVGLIRAADDNKLNLVRGSKLPVQVKKRFDAEQVLKSAVKKHADQDQNFCDIENYCLMYPDMKIVDVAPGAQHKFTVQKGKDEMGRSYSKIDLIYAKQSVLKKIVHLRIGLKGSSIQMLSITTQFLLKRSFVPH